jgi:hypothetical protein
LVEVHQKVITMLASDEEVVDGPFMIILKEGLLMIEIKVLLLEAEGLQSVIEVQVVVEDIGKLLVSCELVLGAALENFEINKFH